MSSKYNHHNLTELRQRLWDSGVVPKKWMLNYIKRAEAIYLLDNITPPNIMPDNYTKIIKERCSKHRKKMYRSKKNRQAGFAAPLTREERLRHVMNTAEALTFVEINEHKEGFVSYLGSRRGKVAFTFKDSSDATYLFTRAEVEKLASMGLYVPRGVITSARNKIQKPAKSTNTLKNIFGN